MFPSRAGSGKGCVLPHSRMDGISRGKCHLVVENRNRGGHTTRWHTAMVRGCNGKMAKNKTKPNICHFLLLTCLRHRCGFLGPHSSWVFPFWDPQTYPQWTLFKLKFCTKNIPCQISNLGSESWFIKKCSEWILLRGLFFTFALHSSTDQSKGLHFPLLDRIERSMKGLCQKICNTKMAYGTNTCIFVWFFAFLFISFHSSPLHSTFLLLHSSWFPWVFPFRDQEASQNEQTIQISTLMVWSGFSVTIRWLFWTLAHTDGILESMFTHQ